MILVDVNLLLYAVNRDAPEHEAASTWLTERLNGDERTGLPWESLTKFVRLITHPRILREPLTGTEAWAFVNDWLTAPAVWIPTPTDGHAAVLGALISRYRLQGNAIPDAHLAAMAITHGLAICSADTDFARFPEARWQNPIA